MLRAMATRLKIPRWKRKLPNAITWTRIAAIPLVVVCLMTGRPESSAWACLFFVIASVTDFLDGYLARRFNVVSVVGQFLDPVADKLLVTAALIMLIPLKRVSALLVVLLLSRDLLINGVRSVAASRGVVMAANWTAKWKTGTQMVAIPILIFGDEMWQRLIPSPPGRAQTMMTAGQILLWMSFGLSAISAAQYLRLFFARPEFDEDDSASV